ncbi:MAG: tagatose 1,6-diphosphate aldolase [Chloroflexi bacterium]|nr:tagatose 1,6-diphosphate aldolase [Chloroflexota bacterium]
MLTIGKIRGLQQISSPDGVFAICAMDHRGSLKSMIAKAHPGEVSYQAMVERKLELCETLAPHSTAALLDPNYGTAQCIASGMLPGRAGLLISTEASGYLDSPQGRLTTLQQGWSVEKIRRVGGSGAKLLLHYRPDLSEVASHQLAVTRSLAEECLKHDLLCVVEPKTYPIEGETELQLNERKPELVIQTAKQITSLAIDVLKAEFPADLSQIKDEASLLTLCHRLDEASRTPWVILSAGANFDSFCREVKLACQAGASGFLAGRAIWQEAEDIDEKEGRIKFLSTVAVDRMKRLMEITTKYAAPWYKKLRLSSRQLAQVSETWFLDY